MNALPRHARSRSWLEILAIAASAGLLLSASWLPVVEIKGFDTFALESVAMWATRAARFTLIASLLCLLIRQLGVSRWWLALSVGILIGPLADMAFRASDLAKMMLADGSGDIGQMIVARKGAWFCVAGLVFWLIDAVIAIVGLIRSRRDEST